MFEPEQYELIDFGHGRKLERFGSVTLDRPCPASEGILPVAVSAWGQATASYVKSAGGQGVWKSQDKDFKSGNFEWSVAHGAVNFLLNPTEFGHVGVFPEQAVNWVWITRQVKRCVKSRAANPDPDGTKVKPRVLNLFAYTGGSTLAAAAAGAEVVHVDAAKSTVAWARRNATAAGMDNAPIRWMVDDATKFVQREVKRGHQYDGIILDPPSYGHGPKGQSWKIRQHLLPLLRQCAELTSESRQFILLTCHAPNFGPAEAEACLAQSVFGSCSAGATARRLDLVTRSGRKLNAGVVARWPG